MLPEPLATMPVPAAATVSLPSLRATSIEPLVPLVMLRTWVSAAPVSQMSPLAVLSLVTVSGLSPR